jgi:mono/diheme cytochrome c family protein
MPRSTGVRPCLVLILGLAGLGGWYAFDAAHGSPGEGPTSRAETGNRPAPPPKTAAAPADRLAGRFTTQIRPFLERYCFSCHGPKKHRASLDLSRDATMAAVVKNIGQWELVRERLHAREMPPAKAPLHPRPEERAAMIAWIGELCDREAERTAGDPGIVLARRLSNAEFDYTINDLTGVDIRPAREFPVDPANQAGFDNSGESLAMSPALLKKYLAAARLVADHVVVKADGFVFAPHPVVTETDRDKYCVKRIIDFYQRHRVDYADCFLASWRFEHRAALGKRAASLADFAGEAGLSPKYLATVYAVLHQPRKGPLGEVQAAWGKLPAEAQHPDEARRGCQRLRDLVTRLRKGLTPPAEKLPSKVISRGSQPLVLWRNAQIAVHHLLGSAPADPDAVLFCRVFPDTFVITERAPYYDPGSSPKGRLLSAGFHLMQGYYRDDGPLYELVLNDASRRELDALWEELHFITQDPLRQYRDFIFFERAESPRFIGESAFDFARSEDRDLTSAAKIEQLRQAYLAKARRLGENPSVLAAIETFYTTIAAQIRKVENDRLAAEPSHLRALVQFAERAYRRPLTVAERDGLPTFYRRLRREEGLGHEDALRDTLASVLLSPHFCYRFDLPGSGPGVRPLSDYALANRLSYFLWSSMPDAELLRHAAAGDLHQAEVLTAQARRMLRDPRVRRLATEFAGNWLDFRRFEEHNAVDRQRFSSFTNELRQAMFEEPIRYLVDVAQRNRSVLDLLYGQDTFVNGPLAHHYGMPAPPAVAAATVRERWAKPLPDGRGSDGVDEWIHVEDARLYGRGGLLPMAVFLTKNAPGLRTSPVKRGYWVVRRLLGEQIPPPPPTVPALPKDEAKTGQLTLPQLLARHRADQSCAGCHRRFDSVGLVFEGFGPVGERRTQDLGGRPVDTTATFPDGKERHGVPGLQEYLRQQRQDDFVDNLCKKLFSYALGRSLILSDRKTLAAMRARLAADGHTFGSLVEVIVTSPQFVNGRGRDHPLE